MGFPDSADGKESETWFQSLGWEDPWSRAWQPTPVFLPGESQRIPLSLGATVHGVPKGQTQLRDQAQHIQTGTKLLATTIKEVN